MNLPFNIPAPLASDQPAPDASAAMARDSTVDRDSFDRLMIEHLPAAHRLAIRLCGNAAGGEEIVQEAMLRAAQAWRGYRGEAKFTTWLFQIVVNVFRDRIRRRRADSLEAIDLPDARSADPRDAVSGAELGELIAGHISRLPPRQREVLVLVAYESLTIGEVAMLLEISEQNVRTNLHFARQTLKERLGVYIEGKSRCGKANRAI